MNYMTVKEAARKWGYSQETVRKWCRDKKITVTLQPMKVSGRWQIPEEAECPKQRKIEK